jgi:hypothetical protein
MQVLDGYDVENLAGVEKLAFGYDQWYEWCFKILAVFVMPRLIISIINKIFYSTTKNKLLMFPRQQSHPPLNSSLLYLNSSLLY